MISTIENIKQNGKRNEQGTFKRGVNSRDLLWSKSYARKFNANHMVIRNQRNNLTEKLSSALSLLYYVYFAHIYHYMHYLYIQCTVFQHLWIY